MADSGHYYISDASLVGPKLFDMLDSIRKYEIISEGGDLVGALIDIDIAQVTLIFLPKEKTKTLITGLKNVVRDLGYVSLRAGAGIVLTHPETMVRGQRFLETGGILGWYVSGPALQVSVGKQFEFGRRFFAGVEGKAVGAWARVPIVGGNADVPNLSLHGLLSAGWRF